MAKQHLDKISTAFNNTDLITKALAKGVREAMIKHKQAGKPIVVWRNEKIVWIPADEIQIEDENE
jgi:hypothetical protein